MSGETTTTPGKTYDTVNGEANTLAKLNLLGNPSIKVNRASIGTDELIDASVTSDKLSTDVIAQINAEAILGDGSVTAAKIATGAVTFVKLNQDVLDQMVRRAVVTSTSGNFLKYNGTTGITEEVAVDRVPGAAQEVVEESTDSGTSPAAANATTSFTLANCSEVSGTLMGEVTDNSGVQATDVMQVSFNFFKNAAGTWAGVANSHGSQAPVAAITQNAVGANVTGTTTLTGGIVLEGGRTNTYTITITDNNILFQWASTATTIKPTDGIKVRGIAIIRA